MGISSMSSSSFGSPSPFHLPWDTLKVAVLSITVKAYKAMKADKIAKQDWEEDTFTLILRNYIRKQLDKENLPIQVETQQEVYTVDMHSGAKSTKTASKIDLKLFRPLDKESDEFYFAWECKRIGLKDKDLRSNYISKGLVRFIKGEYSAQRDAAGMLGYILDSNASTLTDEINQSMLRRKKHPTLSSSDHLKLADAIEGFSDVYTSNHRRLNGLGNIELYHLFFSFVWATSSSP